MGFSWAYRDASVGEAASTQYGVFRDSDGISDRALFFIDAAGVIRDTWVAEHPGVAPGLNIIFDALERIQGARGKETPRA